MNRTIIAALAASLVVFPGFSQDSQKLTGNVIGTELSVNYSTGSSSTTVNTVADAFDGNFNTFFASYERSFTWAGLELEEPMVITRVGFAARNDELGPQRCLLGVFQGANDPDFMDALPIHLITGEGKIGEMTYADVECSRAFKYVRYVGPHDARCNIAELEFYGYPSEGSDDHLFQVSPKMPTVVVNTPGMEWFHSWDKGYEMNGSSITVISDFKVDVSAPGQIRGRGNNSWSYDKKPFRIKFDKKQTVLGGPAKCKKWTMINNYGDKTLMRNRLAFDISERIGLAFTPACHFVDLIFNGEYQGCYQLCDQVEVNPGRVEITEMTPEDNEGEALTGGYFIEIDAYASSEDPGTWFENYGGYRLPVTIKSPDEPTDAQFNYIKNRVYQMAASVSASNFSNPESGYRKNLDLDSFLRLFIVGELSGNTDTYWSTYVSLERGDDQFRFGPVWDFDLAFENDNRTYPINSKPGYIFKYGSSAGSMKNLVDRIVSGDPGAKEDLKYMWSYARVNSGLDIETFEALIDSYVEQLDYSQRLNFIRWPILNEYVHQNPRIYGSYEGEVQNVRDYLRNRFEKLDNLIGRVPVSKIETVECGLPAEVTAVYTLQGTYMGGSAENLPKGIYIVLTTAGAEKRIVR